MEKDFDKAFDEFLECDEYDNAQKTMFDLVRLAFKTGWETSGGSPANPPPNVKLLPKKPKG
jgi:hypothetical protein